MIDKAKQCFDQWKEKYDNYVSDMDNELTVLAREEEERQRRLMMKQPSPPPSERPIVGNIEDLIDVSKSRIRRGQLERIGRLLDDNHLDINERSVKYKGWTAAIAAARQGRVTVMRYLVSRGADVNISDSVSILPLPTPSSPEPAGFQTAPTICVRV